MTDTLYRPLGRIVDEYVHWAKNPKARIGTGYSILDARTSGGIAQGEMLMFLARSGVGKTTMALNFVANNRSRPVVFFSLEMHARYIAQKLAAVAYDVSTANIESDIRNTGRSVYLDQLQSDFPMTAIVDEPGMGFKEMGRALDEIRAEWGTPPQLVLIDFLELVGGVNSLEAMGQVDKAARKAKDFARNHDIALVVLHQVGRGAGGQGHLPLTETSGRFGGEVSADYIMGAFRPHLEPELTQRDQEALQGQIWLQFLKTRGGHETHREGMRHNINPASMRITERNPTHWSSQGYTETELELAGVGA
ncbi:MAG: DnaB-like helicase C-terminal domain-containing protein [Actinomycetota bacterium]